MASEVAVDQEAIRQALYYVGPAGIVQLADYLVRKGYKASSIPALLVAMAERAEVRTIDVPIAGASARLFYLPGTRVG